MLFVFLLKLLIDAKEANKCELDLKLSTIMLKTFPNYIVYKLKPKDFADSTSVENIGDVKAFIDLISEIEKHYKNDSKHQLFFKRMIKDDEESIDYLIKKEQMSLDKLIKFPLNWTYSAKRSLIEQLCTEIKNREKFLDNENFKNLVNENFKHLNKWWKIIGKKLWNTLVAHKRKKCNEAKAVPYKNWKGLIITIRNLVSFRIFYLIIGLN